MKKSLLLTLAAGVLCSTPLMASSYDLYITGSTAFRANVHDACLKLFLVQPSVAGGTAIYDTGKVIGGDGTQANSNPVWMFTGNASTNLTAIGTNNTLTIHANFTGSVQGMQVAEAMGTPGGNIAFIKDTAGHLVTNSATIAFSDNSSAATPYPVSQTANFAEEKVAVQPFVMVKSVIGGPMTNINNVTWEQMKYLINQGRMPLSAWTYNTADTNTYVYLINRTKDSGTRRTTYAQAAYGYNQGVTIYAFDVTNNVFYKCTNTVNGAKGGGTTSPVSIGVIGSPGVDYGSGGVNLNWGSGYVGGGDVKAELQVNNSNNLALAYLSIADAKTIVSTTNWSQVIAWDGLWPTAAGAGIAGNAGPNNYSPITQGYYPSWGYEVVVYPTVDPNSIDATGQNLTQALLGNQKLAGTILGVLDSQTLINGGSPIYGSLENEIANTVNGATAIRLSDMKSSRSAVGGLISP